MRAVRFHEHGGSKVLSIEDMNAAIVSGAARFARAISNAFEVLNRIEYSAPWAAKAKRARSH